MKRTHFSAAEVEQAPKPSESKTIKQVFDLIRQARELLNNISDIEEEQRNTQEPRWSALIGEAKVVLAQLQSLKSGKTTLELTHQQVSTRKLQAWGEIHDQITELCNFVGSWVSAYGEVKR